MCASQITTKLTPPNEKAPDEPEPFVLRLQSDAAISLGI
jgi:hypothetical protein